MDNILYDSLFNYFNALRQIGFLSYDKVHKLLALTAIKRFISNDVHGYLDKDDYRHIEHAIYCLFGSVCLITFPDLYRLQDMNRMHLGEVSDLAIRTKRLEDLFEFIANSDNYTKIQNISNAILSDVNDVRSEVDSVNSNLQNLQQQVNSEVGIIHQQLNHQNAQDSHLQDQIYELDRKTDSIQTQIDDINDLLSNP